MGEKRGGESGEGRGGGWSIAFKFFYDLINGVIYSSIFM